MSSSSSPPVSTAWEAAAPPAPASTAYAAAVAPSAIAAPAVAPVAVFLLAAFELFVATVPTMPSFMSKVTTFAPPLAVALAVCFSYCSIFSTFLMTSSGVSSTSFPSASTF